MSVINRALIAKRLKPGLAGLLGNDYERYTDQHLQIFDKRISNKAAEEMVMTAGMGLAPVKNEGGTIFLDSIQDAYTARVDHATISIGYAITEEAIEDDLYEAEAESKTAALARSMGQTKEVRAASVLNNGFSGTYTYGDGVALFSASHPLVSGGTQSNTATADLSEAALKSAWTTIRGFVDDRGLKVQAKPEMLIVHPNDHFTAFEILKSDLSTAVTHVSNAGAYDGTSNVVGTTNTNKINSIRASGMFPKGVMVYDFLTDADSWFIKTDIANGLMLWQRRPLKYNMSYTDPYTGNIVCSASERYGFMVGDFRAVYGGQGA